MFLFRMECYIQGFLPINSVWQFSTEKLSCMFSGVMCRPMSQTMKVELEFELWHSSPEGYEVMNWTNIGKLNHWNCYDVLSSIAIACTLNAPLVGSSAFIEIRSCSIISRNWEAKQFSEIWWGEREMQELKLTRRCLLKVQKRGSNRRGEKHSQCKWPQKSRHN